MFWLYRALFFLLSPLLAWRLQRSEPVAEARKRGVRQRRGQVEPAGEDPLWIHAASVGEVNAISPLVFALLKREPSVPLIISTFTVTGAQQVVRKFGERVQHRYLPLDTPRACDRWLRILKPQLGLIAETELWPELFVQAKQQQIPLMLINARLSERGLLRSLRFRALFSRALNCIECALCQSDEDAKRLIKLGLAAGRARVVGNLKFDAVLPPELIAMAQSLRTQWGDRRIWVAGSTRPGEERILIDAHRALLFDHPNALMVIAPRHPEQASSVIEQLNAAGLAHQIVGETVAATCQVAVVDQIGILQACYAAGSVAFVGGSLVDIGGHNLLEPAALGKPVIAGTFLNNQREMATALSAADAITQVSDAQQLSAAIDSLWTDPEHALRQGRAALSVVERGRGSLAETLKVIRPRLRSTRPKDEPPENSNSNQRRS